MSINPLNDISKIYLEEVAKKKKDNSYLETDFKKRQANNEKARKDLMKGPQMKNPHFEEKQLDPVGQEDDDIDNDGKKNTKTDKYLLKRRKAIAKAMKEAKNLHGEIENPNDLKSAVKKAVKRIDTNVSGDVNKKDKSMGDYGEFVPTPDGKKVTTKMESFSNWRDDLREVMGEDGKDQKQVKEKNVKNTIKINPKISEEVTILESTEMDEVDLAAYTVYDELVQEGFDVYDVEDAIEYAIIEAKVTYGHDTEKPYEKDTSAGRMIKAVGRLARQKLKSAGKKAKLKSAQAQVAAYNKGREVKQKAGDKVRGAKVGLKAKIKKVAQKVVDRMSEEIEVQETSMQMSPQEVALQKKKAMVDQQIAQKRKQALNQVKKKEEELDERTRYAKETGKDPQTGKSSVKGGEGRSEAGKYMQKMMRSTGGAMSSRGKAIAVPGKKKEKGAKPKFKSEPTPVDKIKRKLSDKRAPKKDPYGYGQGRYQGD